VLSALFPAAKVSPGSASGAGDTQRDFAVGSLGRLVKGFVIAYLGVSPILATLGR